MSNITTTTNEALANRELGSTAYFTCNTLWTLTGLVISEELQALLLLDVGEIVLRYPGNVAGARERQPSTVQSICRTAHR
jgi:hypothetical protein